MSSSTHISQEDCCLPVDAFYLNDGFRPAVGQDLEILWSSGISLIVKSNYKASSDDHSIAREDCKSFKWSKPDKDKKSGAVVQIATNNGVLTVRFDVENYIWSQTKYRNFIKAFSHLRPSEASAQVLWEHARRLALAKRSATSSESRRIKLRLTFGAEELEEGQDRRKQDSSSGLVKRKRSESTATDAAGVVDKDLERHESPSSKRRDLNSPSCTNVTSRDCPAAKRTPAVNQDEIILVYPEGTPGAMNITDGDLARLEPGQFLNDTLIEFGLKFWLKTLQDEDAEFANQIHIFNSFFYKKLSSKKDPQQAYEGVKQWTAKVEIFRKKYIIVPINEDLHWYLAIIYEPEHVLSPAPREPTIFSEEGLASEEAELTDPTSQGAIQDLQDMTGEAALGCSHTEVFQDSCNVKNGASCADLSSLRSKAIIDLKGKAQTRFRYPVPADKEVPPLRTPCSPSVSPAAEEGYLQYDKVGSNLDLHRKEVQHEQCKMLNTDRPETFIFTMDSLGNRHPEAVKRLADYLKMEARHRKGVVNGNTATGKTASVPIQPNFCDCGLYLLHLAQTFMSKPQEYRHRILAEQEQSTTNEERRCAWREVEVEEMRDKMKGNIQHLSAEWKKDRAAEAQAKRDEAEADASMSSSESDLEMTTS